MAFTNERTDVEAAGKFPTDRCGDDDPVPCSTSLIYDVTLYVTGYEGSELVEAQTAVVEVPHAKAAFAEPQPRHGARTALFFLNLLKTRTRTRGTSETGPQAKKPSPCTNTRGGLYDVTLTASNEFGCRTTYVLPEAVLAEEGGMMRFPNAFTPSSTGSSGGYRPAATTTTCSTPACRRGNVRMMVFTGVKHLSWTTCPLRGLHQRQIGPSGRGAWKATAVLSNGNRLRGNVTLLNDKRNLFWPTHVRVSMRHPQASN